MRTNDVTKFIDENRTLIGVDGSNADKHVDENETDSQHRKKFSQRNNLLVWYCTLYSHEFTFVRYVCPSTASTMKFIPKLMLGLGLFNMVHAVAPPAKADLENDNSDKEIDIGKRFGNDDGQNDDNETDLWPQFDENDENKEDDEDDEDHKDNEDDEDDDGLEFFNDMEFDDDGCIERTYLVPPMLPKDILFFQVGKSSKVVHHTFVL